MIRLESVTRSYGRTIAVDDLSLEAPSGQITVFVGPSGCGKTTSLRMINRMIEPTSGRIFIDDRDTSKGTAAKLRRGIGYVIQQAGLFPHRTIVENIATVPVLVGKSRREAHATARELMERVGLDPALADRYPAQLSGGQQQRVGVARALAADPPVMLMDEPFSAVDPVVREQLQDEFLRLQAELGKTIVFVTHDIDEAIKLGDQVAVLRVGGKLAQLATPAELLSRPADAFVAGFVGRDRGYRALGFAAAGQLPLHAEPIVALGSDLARASSARPGRLGPRGRLRRSPAGLAGGGRSAVRATDRCGRAKPAQPWRHARDRGRDAARGPRFRAVLAERPRRHRPRGRPVRRHCPRLPGARPNRGAGRHRPLRGRAADGGRVCPGGRGRRRRERGGTTPNVVADESALAVEGEPST